MIWNGRKVLTDNCQYSNLSPFKPFNSRTILFEMHKNTSYAWNACVIRIINSKTKFEKIKIFCKKKKMFCVRSSDQDRSTDKPGLKHTHFAPWMNCLLTESATTPPTFRSLSTYRFCCCCCFYVCFPSLCFHTHSLSHTMYASLCMARTTCYDRASAFR